MRWTVRLTQEHDYQKLPAVERDAGKRFHEVGLSQVAEDAPAPVESHARAAAKGLHWVAVDEADEPVGFAMAARTPPWLYLAEVSITTGAAGHGIGRALIAQVQATAMRERSQGVVLRTFADVPWNGPYYARLGFAPLDDASIPAVLADMPRKERERGMDPDTRLFMVWFPKG
ncbi:GNAT family N-acetyltransferase [Chondromyces apiculatus]|uniref:GCN5-related N-acetyltransferase n=1 Tax=Chondromyces apiculatus DSM 436 TaxID=1192034 RepID=A0A017TCK3_9BACT|nr:GNAT family N-acetyltransferase [Chondromyces apiculatus]EYF06361.1 GCN5-related N-acetyltransferase [Chondromyces apiculatus DSM 436]